LTVYECSQGTTLEGLFILVLKQCNKELLINTEGQKYLGISEGQQY